MSNPDEHTKGEGKEESKEEKRTESTPASAGKPFSSDESSVDDLKTKIVELEQKAASLKDQLLRKAAEFENYKKRIENDFAAMARFANEQIIMQLLPIVDDFARSLKSAKNRPESDSFNHGIGLIYNKFLRLLERNGVKEIETVGKLFDVYYHEAIMEMPKAGVPPHTIIEEVEKGYMLHDKVIRHAKVIIAGEPHALARQPKDEVELLEKKNLSAETGNDPADGKREPGTQPHKGGEHDDE